MSDKYIWLINLGDEITWCNDPDPSDGIEDEDVTGYTRNDLADEFKTRITELENEVEKLKATLEDKCNEPETT